MDPSNKTWEGHEGVVLDAAGSFEVIECAPCGFKHVLPLPSTAELGQFYRNNYHTAAGLQYFQACEVDREWWKQVYGDRFETFESLLPGDRRRVLDIGSGLGLFLQCGVQRGWQGMGVEPSEVAAGHCRSLGFEIVQELFHEACARELPRMDVVHLSAVLEHVADPAQVLRLAHDLLEGGGLVCAVVPNDYSPFQQALRKGCGYRPWWVSLPAHLNYFSPTSLEGLLLRSGFEVVLREGSFPIDLFLLMGDNYVDDPALGRKCHERRMRFEQNLAAAGMTDLKRRLYRELGKLGVGREILLVGRKLG